MSSSVSFADLAGEIRRIYTADASQAEASIERYLEKLSSGRNPSERLDLLQALTHEFESSQDLGSDDADAKLDPFPRLVSLLLGREVSTEELPPAELLKRLAASLNTVFDHLNEISSVINATLLGKEADDMTIRQTIDKDLRDGRGKTSLETYLERFKKAFLATHKAFEQAAHREVHLILGELDPDRIATQEEGSFRIGAFRKAKLSEVYREKYRKVRKWYDSGRFEEEFLREFERAFQNLYIKEAK